MKSVHAVYEHGVFRPTEPVDLPDGCRVVVEADPSVQLPWVEDESLDDLYAILARRFRSGVTDTAARHNEHQP